MNELRAFINVRKKRIVSLSPLRNLGAVLLFVFFVPYVITGLFGNIGEDSTVSGLLTAGSITVENHTDNGTENIPLELYVADKLSRVMPPDYEMEALKAQRSSYAPGCWKQAGEVKM